uniref:Mitochondrial inner membrane protein OXA1L n=1 Tax=Lygus hesperus TaxID=30085 RepID=A0A0A9X6M1_LYGHE
MGMASTTKTPPLSSSKQTNYYIDKYARRAAMAANDGTNAIVDEEYLKCRDGTLLSIELCVKQIYVEDLHSESGTKSLLLNYMREVTGRYEMQQVNEIDESVTQHCPTALFSFDVEGNIFSPNAAAAELFGMSIKALQGAMVTSLLPALQERLP